MAGGIIGNGTGNLTPVANGITCSAAYANGVMVYPTASWHTIYENTTGKSVTVGGNSGSGTISASTFGLSNFSAGNIRITGKANISANPAYGNIVSFSSKNISGGTVLVDLNDGSLPPIMLYMVYCTGTQGTTAITFTNESWKRPTKAGTKTYYNTVFTVTKIEQYY